jgi:hypothetical protein
VVLVIRPRNVCGVVSVQVNAHIQNERERQQHDRPTGMAKESHYAKFCHMAKSR